ncbi:DUF3617 family protein [Bradyrhizobium tropiciagri]|uniref:DUF3617 domain-containing protein n=1 Tax=Bradyrhizobium tropiciagri TaxID=312253 RepID=UPI001BAB0C11|nr:DUF3617 family protein [Bradyrhizobium tropiciagri]MBR0898867.1 DUF3617 family protein [Bradyrhizobium tropiciagri]
MVRISALLIPVAVFLTSGNLAVADSAVFPSGAYSIVSRLELPHVERWAVDQTSNVCLSGRLGEGDIPIPVLSANNPFKECTAVNLVASGAAIEYDIICPGRASAKAHATYQVAQGEFSGRVAMIMGAKNMTMTEVVRARRTGECESRSDTRAAAVVH